MGTVRASHEVPNLRVVLKTCATCKHYDPLPEEPSGYRDIGKCRRIKTSDPLFPKGGAFILRSEGGPAELFVHETFGCVLHEEKVT